MSILVPALLSGLVMLALWVSAGSSGQQRTGPSVAPLGPGARPPDIPIAAAGQVQVRLPVDPEKVTAIAFHPVDDPRGLELRPMGPLKMHEIPPDARRGTARGGVDVGAEADTVVYSPIDGTIIAKTPYVVRGRPKGHEFAIKPSDAIGMVVLVNHVEEPIGAPAPSVGDSVQAGRTRLGRVIDMSDVVDQEIAQFTADSGNHVSILVSRLDNE